MTDKEYDWNKTWMTIAVTLAKRSHCCRKKVACVIVKNGHIISTGINGAPKGMENCDTHFKGVDITSPDFMKVHGEFSTKYELHGEQNAIALCAQNEVSPAGATAFVTLAPCVNCAKLIIAAGITKVYYFEPYDRDMSGVDLLRNAGIQIEEFPWVEQEYRFKNIEEKK